MPVNAFGNLRVSDRWKMLSIRHVGYREEKAPTRNAGAWYVISPLRRARE
jgi:hypothetical protein